MSSLCLLLLPLLACGDKDADSGSGATDSGATDGDTSTDGTTADGPGTLSLSWEIDDDYLEKGELDHPAQGTFHGSVFAEDDATSTGPVDGAEPLADIEVDGIDFVTGANPTEALWTSPELEPQVVWILGCLDIDDNGCDSGDVVTIPNENKVIVEPGVTTSFTVQLGITQP
ncbi:MAG: hypothetical protein H6742_03680 [Alphaproteobacteria bacterium]|nr:hypothetical protein [Alphaproteobacteria bacterium]